MKIFLVIFQQKDLVSTDPVYDQPFLVVHCNADMYTHIIHKNGHGIGIERAWEKQAKNRNNNSETDPKPWLQWEFSDRYNNL